MCEMFVIFNNYPQANLMGKLIHKFHIINDNTPCNDVVRKTIF